MAFDFPSNPILDQSYTAGAMTYTWNGYAWIAGGSPTAGAPGDYVLKAGDTMTGPLTLDADPMTPLVAATKQYVDARSTPPPGVGSDGQALVASAGAPVWGAPIEGGNY